MHTTTLPRRQVSLTALGLGAAPLGNLHHVVSDDDAAGAVDAAWAGGIRYFDTAPHYGLGLSERRLGRLLRDRPRADVVVSTKVGRVLVPSPETAHVRDEGFAVPADLRREWDFSRDGVRRSLDASLERTGFDRFDIVLVHDPDEHWEQASREAVPALAELRDQGVIGAVGVGMNQSAMLAEFVRCTDVDVVLCAGRYTLLEQGALEDLLPLAHERRVGVVAAGVYNSGLLALPRPPADATYDYVTAPADVLARAHRLADTCERHGVSLPEAAIEFAGAHPAVVSVVIGAQDGDQVRAALQHAEQPIPPELWGDLRAQGLLAPHAPVPA